MKKKNELDYDELTSKEKEILKKLIDEIKDLATEVVKDYEVNPPVSGSEGTIIQVHENSPILDEKKKSR